ncbi:unnamed protein product [Trichobilharzia regenti]|nr:unnamed protein product [Trichobilharzia regenti]
MYLYFSVSDDVPITAQGGSRGPSGLGDNASAFETIGTGFQPQWEHHHSLGNAVSACHRDTQRSYIRDPQTNCVSSRKLSIRKCSGTCDSNIFQHEQHQQLQQQLNKNNSNNRESMKFYKWKTIYKRSSDSVQVWLPRSSKEIRSSETVNNFNPFESSHSNQPNGMITHLSNKQGQQHQQQQQYCCQATKIKLRPILFNCPNGAVYERTIKLAKRCGCVQCGQ